MNIKKIPASTKKFPTWLKIIIGVVLILITFIGVDIYSDQKTEKNINKRFYQEIADIPEIKVNNFTLWEGDSIVNIDILNKGNVHFWYGRNGVPRIDAIDGFGISQVCYYIDQKGIKKGYAGSVSLVLDYDNYYKEWFPFNVLNLRDLVIRYDDISRIVATFPKNPETEIFHDKLWGSREVVKNPDPNFIVHRKINNKEVTCDLLQ